MTRPPRRLPTILLLNHLRPTVLLLRSRRCRRCLPLRLQTGSGRRDQIFPDSHHRVAVTNVHYVARRAIMSGSVRGSRNATLRMGASRNAARGVVEVLRDFQRDGVSATLRRLNLGDLVGRPFEEVFIGLTDIVCMDGGSIDEGIALDAWLETVADLEGLNVTDPTALTQDQMRDIFLTFMAHTIEGRLLQDIGANGLKVAADLAAIEAFEDQLRDYIRRSVRDSFSSDIGTPVALTDRHIQDIVDRTYQNAWELLVTWGDTTG